MEKNVILNRDGRECLGILADIEYPVIVTDPPFNVGYHYDKYDDNKDDAQYYADLAEMLSHCPSVVVHYPEALFKLAHCMDEMPTRVVSWVYNSNTPRQHRDIAYFRISPNFAGLGEYKNPNDKRIAALIADGRKPIGYDWLYCDQIKNVSAEKTGHPCQMPLEVMLYVLHTLPPNVTVIDPFAGSGTTLLAAKRLGMDYIGYEISDEYCHMAKNRLLDDAPLLDFVPM